MVRVCFHFFFSLHFDSRSFYLAHNIRGYLEHNIVHRIITLAFICYLLHLFIPYSLSLLLLSFRPPRSFFHFTFFSLSLLFSLSVTSSRSIPLSSSFSLSIPDNRQQKMYRWLVVAMRNTNVRNDDKWQSLINKPATFHSIEGKNTHTNTLFVALSPLFLYGFESGLCCAWKYLQSHGS